MKTGRGNLPVTLYELDDFQPRAWFVENVEVHAGKNLPWGTFTAQSFDPGRTAFISQADIGSNRSFTLGSVTDIQYSLHELTVKTESTAEGFLVISEVYYPLRWKAKIDGKEVKYFETNGVIRGLIVPPGNHEIKFIYDRSSFRKGITKCGGLFPGSPPGKKTASSREQAAYSAWCCSSAAARLARSLRSKTAGVHTQ